ncbi:hypothetical protein B0T17DRAFT_619969 [Bombardia bombarda]|uniref:Apple domain-containing protein n=1 Tax=Bombardia bombarda TaxID=252184 RepID=A0AA39WGZ2_9PEZI|nr:hypothetical protein B0T17DRAFT_619969 [Bombardia bombarda]
MHYNTSAVVAASMGLLPSLASALTPAKCNVLGVIEYLACLTPIPETCVAGLAEQATAFCSSYLDIEAVTVYTSTNTPVVTVGATEAVTTVITTTELTTSTTQTTGTVVATSISRDVTTRTVTVTAVPTMAPRQLADTTTCVDLTKKNPTKHHKAPKLSAACSCLGISATTVFLEATASVTSTETATETSVATEIMSETSVEIEVSTSTETSTRTLVEYATSTTIQTAVPTIDYCGQMYIASGNGQGNAVSVVSATSGRDCCEKCRATQNCVASTFSGGQCQLLTKRVQLAGAPTSDLCPLGIEDYNFGPVIAGGVVYAGSCGY